MKQLEQSLTEGSLGKKIFLFSLPLMLSNLLQVLFNMADIAVVGKFAGSNALGSVGSTAILVTLFTSFLIGVGGGINVLVALHIGAGNKKEAKETITTAYVLCLCMGILLLLVGISSARGILSLMNTKPELIDGAVLYLRIYFLGLPAVGVYNCGNAILSAAGDTKKPLYFLSIAGVVNVALNLLLVIVFHLDVAGVDNSSKSTSAGTSIEDVAYVDVSNNGSNDIMISYTDGGKTHYAIVNVTLGLNTKAKDYASKSTTINNGMKVIVNAVQTEAMKYTYSTIAASKTTVESNLLATLQDTFQTECITSVIVSVVVQ